MTEQSKDSVERWRVTLAGLVDWSGAGQRVEAEVRVLQPPPAEATPQNLLGDDEDYGPEKRRFRAALAPAICLAGVIATLIAAMLLVGYNAVGAGVDNPEDAAVKLAATAPDQPARRSALAYSGATMAITFVLSFTSWMWARGAALGKHADYVRWVRSWLWPTFITAFLALATALYLEVVLPYSSLFGQVLLRPEAASLAHSPAVFGPYLMFFLAWFVPANLASGASLMLQPMREPDAVSKARAQLAVLSQRLKELDQLLYIGAMTLVFGTLQLSAAMSVPLASIPTSAEVKAKADLCKAIVPSSSSAATAPVRSVGPAAATATKPALPSPSTTFLESRPPCKDLQSQAEAAEFGDGLRKLVKGVTFSFGLAFSALLAAIYVPAVTVLRGIMAGPGRWRDAANENAGKTDGHAGTDADPAARLVAIAATLSPLIAGILANALA